MPGTDKAGVLAMEGVKSGDQWGKGRHLEFLCIGQQEVCTGLSVPKGAAQ